MASLNNLSVSSVQDLRTEATAFQTHADEVHKITNQMLDLVSSSTNIWRGDAQASFSTKFTGLSADMEKIYQIITKYCTDLQEIAANFEAGETKNQETMTSQSDSIGLAKN